MLELGSHKRAFVYRGIPDYDDIIREEESGDFIDRKVNPEEERGPLLVMGEFIRL
jgi:hypothetical protein